MKNFNAFYLITFLSITLFSCCKDEPKCQDPTKIECENYDPCYGRKSVSADFVIYESTSFAYPDSFPRYDTDTIVTDGAIFKALEEGAEYEWHIGSEVIKDKSFGRTDFPMEVPIPITLIVKKAPNKACSPNDDGIDSVKRILWRTDFYKHSKVFGTYKGYFDDNKKDTATIKIFQNMRKVGPVKLEQHVNIVGLIDGCADTLYNYSLPFYGFKGNYNAFPFSCKRPHGGFLIRGNNNDTLEASFYQERVKESFDRIKRKFKGIRQ
jgi:hypothetical protein